MKFSKPKLMGKNIYIDKNATIGKNVVIYENNRIEGHCKIGNNVILYPNNYIISCSIGDNTSVSSSVLEHSVIGNNCKIGPYSHIRPNCDVGNKVKIGNFCELKSASVGDQTNISHLAYVGDSVIGCFCNIGCGAIFVNYDGKNKHKIVVEDSCFIGSNVNLIAPIHIMKHSYICAGTTLTESTQENDFVIGRSIPTIKHDRGLKYYNKSQEK